MTRNGNWDKKYKKTSNRKINFDEKRAGESEK